MISRFAQRSSQIEIMDDLQCGGEVVNQTLRELEFINRWLGGNAITMEGVKELAAHHSAITIADLGCGSGDMLKMFADWGRKNKCTLSLTGIDANPNIIEFARNNCKEYPEIQFETMDVFSDAFRLRNFDIIVGTLFFHHFSQVDLIDLLFKLKRQVRLGLVINDLHRHWFAFYAIRLLTRLFSKSAMVRFDAPLSVLRSFSRDELMDLLLKAGIMPYQLRWKWAFRWQVIHAVNH
jgi:2-polyprenyl-3-methyl-5-hydroxy-6-metoxy-1,4-benzoquinol methylase